MLLSTALTELRDVLADPAVNSSSNTTWPDAELIRNLSRQVRGLFRDQTQIDEAYHNCDINLVSTGFQNIETTAWDYPFKPYVERVVNVWYRSTLPAGSTDAEAPVRVVNGSGTTIVQTRDKMLATADIRQSRQGWRFHTLYGLRIVGFQTIPMLVCQVAKSPAPLTRGTIELASGSTSKFYLVNETTATAADGLHDQVDDSYRNATFHFTSTADSAGSILTGVTRRCIGSKMVFTSSARRIEIQLDAALPRALAATTDTYEMCLEVPESASRYVILLAARAAFEKKHNIEGIKAITPELMEQRQEFRNFVAPRGMQEAKTVQDTLIPQVYNMPDTALDNSGWYG